MSKKNTFRKWLSITLGVVAAMAVLCSQSFTFTTSPKAEKETQKEVPNNHDKDHHDLPSISQDAVSSFVQLTISHGLHFITNIYHNTIEVVSVDVAPKIDFNTFFKTLFRLIISPNAP